VKSIGCDACNQTGYRGRLALFEAKEPDELFTTPGSVAARRLQTMGSEGVRLVAEGHTTMEEIIRILGIKYF
jgi:general secretion pathway protein E